VKRFPLHIKILLGLFLGVVWAFFSGYMGWSKFTLRWIEPFGAIFIDLLKLIAVPLVLFSIIKGISGLKDVSKLGKMGVKTLVFYLSTTVLAVGIGVLLANVISPGDKLKEEQRITNRISYELWMEQEGGEKISDNRNFLHNPDYAEKVEAARKQNSLLQSNKKVEEGKAKVRDKKEEGPLQFLREMIPSNLFASLSNNGLMLQTIFFALFFGITLLMVPAETTQPIIQFVHAGDAVFLKMVDLIMRGAPFFVFALLAGKLAEMAGDNPAGIWEIFKGLGWYSLTVLIGLAIMIFAVYPTLYLIFVKNGSYKHFFKAMAPAQMLAFSTSSSVATLPVTMERVHKELKVPEEVTGFVLPIGATINMDGTSLYQAVAVIFLAQFHLVDLSLTQQITIVLTATLASIGSAAVPSAGLIMLIIVLESVGLNPAWIAIIFPVDRILDMCRTVVNVTGDAVVSSAIAAGEYGNKS
jgi:Na+/H+-dicarboxylate symporter